VRNKGADFFRNGQIKKQPGLRTAFRVFGVKRISFWEIYNLISPPLEGVRGRIFRFTDFSTMRDFLPLPPPKGEW
jgi:hypothetical protein